MENKKDYIEQISELLIELIDNSIKASKDAGLLDASIKHEYTIKNILNIVYDLKIINTNDIKSNYPGIDLVDEENKKVYQISSQQDKDKKVDYTIKQVEKYNLINKYSISNIDIIFLTDEKASFNKESKERWEKWAYNNKVILDYYTLDDFKSKIIQRLQQEQNDNKIHRLLQYLQINKKDDLFTFEIQQYYNKINKKLQQYTTSHFKEFQNKVEDFMKSDNQILLIKAVQGHGKTHFINYLAENSNFNWYIPVLLVNTTYLSNILQDFNNYLNWIIIIDDMDRYDEDFKKYLINGILAKKNIKVIFTCREAYEINIKDYNSLINYETLNIEWEEKHIDELIEKYKEKNQNIKLDYFDIKKIKTETKCNPFFLLFSLNNNLVDIKECGNKYYSDIIKLINDKLHIYDKLAINQYLVNIGLNIPFNINKIQILDYNEESILNILSDNNLMYKEHGTYRYTYDIVGDLILAQAIKSNEYHNTTLALFENITYNNALNIQYMATYLLNTNSDNHKTLNRIIDKCKVISDEALKTLVTLYPEFYIQQLENKILSFRYNNNYYTQNNLKTIQILLEIFADKIYIDNININIAEKYINITYEIYDSLTTLNNMLILPNKMFNQFIKCNNFDIYFLIKNLFYNTKPNIYRNHFFYALFNQFFYNYHSSYITYIDSNLYKWIANIYTSLIILLKNFDIHFLLFINHNEQNKLNSSKILIKYFNKKMTQMLLTHQISLRMLYELEYRLNNCITNNIIELYEIIKVIYSSTDYLLYRLALQQNSIVCYLKPFDYAISLDLFKANTSTQKNNFIIADYYIVQYDAFELAKIIANIEHFNYNQDVFKYILSKRQDVVNILKNMYNNIQNEELYFIIAKVNKQAYSIEKCATLYDFYYSIDYNDNSIINNIDKYINFIDKLNNIEKNKALNFLYYCLLEIYINTDDILLLYKSFIQHIMVYNLYTQDILETLYKYITSIKKINETQYLVEIKSITLNILPTFFNQLGNNDFKPHYFAYIFNSFDTNNNDIIDFTSKIIINEETIHHLKYSYYTLIITTYEKFYTLLDYLYEQYKISDKKEEIIYMYNILIETNTFHKYIPKYVHNTINSNNIEKLNFLIRVFSCDYINIEDLTKIIDTIYYNNPNKETINDLKFLFRHIGTTELDKWEYFLQVIQNSKHDTLKKYVLKQLENELKWHKEYEKKYYERPYKPLTEHNNE